MQIITIFLDGINVDLLFYLEIKVNKLKLKYFKTLTYLWIIHAQAPHHSLYSTFPLE